MKEASRKIQEVDVVQLWDAASTYDLEELRAAVTKLIEDARAPNQSILRKIPTMSKRQLMKVLGDFYLKGCGLGVIK
jgi:hypothetical protein